MQRALARRRRCAAAHLSVTASPCHLSSRRGFGAGCLRGKAPLEGSWREAPERCYRTGGFPQGIGVQRALTRRRRYAAAHLSVTLRVPPLLKERLRGASPERAKAPLEGSWREAPERCYRTGGFPQSFGVCRGCSFGWCGRRTALHPEPGGPMWASAPTGFRLKRPGWRLRPPGPPGGRSGPRPAGLRGPE